LGILKAGVPQENAYGRAWLSPCLSLLPVRVSYALSEAKLLLLYIALLLHLLRRFECPALRRHLHLGAAMKQVVNREYLDKRVVLAPSIQMYHLRFIKQSNFLRDVYVFLIKEALSSVQKGLPFPRP
jgi:hypothetical protein